MRGALLVVIGLILGGCEYTSTTVMVATLLQTPAQQLPGASLDPVVTASVTLENRQLTGTGVTPITGAQLSLDFANDHVSLTELGNGKYQLTSQDQVLLQYLPGVSYTFTAVAGGETFRESVVAPAQEQVPGLQSLTAEALVLPDGTSGPVVDVLPVAPGVDLDLTRTSSSDRDPGTLAVALPTTGATAPLFSWPSLDASGLEDFYLHPDHYEGASLVVPSSVWGQCENPYLVVSFAAMARGSVGGENLSVGSMVQAGSAQMALAHCETGPATQS